MDEGGVDAGRGQLGDRADRPLVHDDRVAGGMPGAAGVTVDDRAEHLMGAAARDRPGDEVAAGILPREVDGEVGLGGLLPVGHELFADDQPGVLHELGAGDPFGRVDPLDLGGVHLHVAALVDADPGLRVDDPSARPFANADVLFEVEDPRVLADEEAVDAVVLGLLLPLVVHAAARHDRDVRAVADVEVVVDEVAHPRVGDAGGDVDGFALCAGQHLDVDARLVGLGGDVHVVGRGAPGAAAVLADVVGRVLRHAGKLGHHLEQHFGDLIHGRFPLPAGRRRSGPRRP